MKAVSAAGTDDMAYGGLKNTTVRVSDDTKRLLDHLREQDGAGSFDELLHKVLSALVQPELPLGPAARSGAGKRAAGNDDTAALYAQVDGLMEQVAELTDTVSGLLELLDGQVQDPVSGLLFNWRKAKRAHAGKLPKPHPKGHARAGIVEKSESFLSSVPEAEALAWVQAPSGAYLTERDGTLPVDVVEAIRDELRAKKPVAGEKPAR